jgi:hypothetical protein
MPTQSTPNWNEFDTEPYRELARQRLRTILGDQHNPESQLDFIYGFKAIRTQDEAEWLKSEYGTDFSKYLDRNELPNGLIRFIYQGPPEIRYPYPHGHCPDPPPVRIKNWITGQTRWESPKKRKELPPQPPLTS